MKTWQFQVIQQMFIVGVEMLVGIEINSWRRNVSWASWHRNALVIHILLYWECVYYVACFGEIVP